MSFGVLLRVSNLPDENAPHIVILTKEKTRVGRQSEVRMDTSRGKEVSKHHSTIFKVSRADRDLWVLEDNNSLNGTFLNGKKIRKSALYTGDEIVFGGGSNFLLGDMVKTDLAQCRYIFFAPPPIVHFTPNLDVNCTLCSISTNEMCPICYGPMVAQEKLRCGHMFCLGCIHEWARTCVKAMRPCLCPMCRAPFIQSELTPEEGMVKPDEVQIWTVEPFLRELGVKSCKAVKGAKIFKKWQSKHSRFFWCSYESVKNNEVRRLLFFHLTGVTIPHILKANREELLNALINLKCQNREGDITYLRKELVLRVYKLFFASYEKNNDSSAQKRRNLYF